MKEERSARQSKRPRRGVYLLPNFLTTACLFCGFYSLISVYNGDYHMAALAIFGAFLFDGLDGRIARATHTTSHFGKEYDSLSDLVAFGVAPATLALSWALMPLGRLGWLGAFLYTACGALRLARFNTQNHRAPRSHFKGLPIPAAAITLAALVLFSHEVGWQWGPPPEVVLAMLYGLAFLMVSNLRYRSFKEIEFGRRSPFQTLVAGVLVLVVILVRPSVTLFVLSGAYVISGPFEMLIKLGRAARGQQEAPKVIPK
jgi:CDP-diacylglycerol--serine O-phosphatidyltransferase